MANFGQKTTGKGDFPSIFLGCRVGGGKQLMVHDTPHPPDATKLNPCTSPWRIPVRGDIDWGGVQNGLGGLNLYHGGVLWSQWGSMGHWGVYGVPVGHWGVYGASLGRWGDL